MKRLVLFFMIIPFFISCSDSDKEDDSFLIGWKWVWTSNEIQGTFTREEQTTDLIIQSDKSWEITSCPEWITCSKYEGGQNDTIQITVKENSTGKERSGKIVIVNYNGHETEVPFYQSQ